jgi:NAD(P)H-dependent FMN reductase
MSAQQSVLLIAGSPSEQSRSSALLDSISHRLALRGGLVVDRLNIRELPAQPLLLAEWGHPAIVKAIEQIARARAIVVATPVYKAAYSGLLKVLLDLLPQTALKEKTVLPLATDELRIGYQKAASILLVLQKAQGSLEKKLAPLGLRRVKWVEFPAGPQAASLLEGLNVGAVDCSASSAKRRRSSRRPPARVRLHRPRPGSAEAEAIVVPKDSPSNPWPTSRAARSRSTRAATCTTCWSSCWRRTA